MENGKWILTRISSYTIRILRGEGKKKKMFEINPESIEKYMS